MQSTLTKGCPGDLQSSVDCHPQFQNVFSPQKEARAHQHPDMHDLPSASVDSPVPDGSFKWNHTQWPFGI